MEKKVRDNAVYISLLPDDVTEAQIQEIFGSIGVIKVCLVLKHFTSIIKNYKT